MSHRRALVWMRRDLRLRDNAALYHACAESNSVACAFVLSPALLRSKRIGAPIVQFFFSALDGLRRRLQEAGSDLLLLEGDFEQELLAVANTLQCDALYFNRDTDPQALARDRDVTKVFESSGRSVSSYTDQVYFAHDAIYTGPGKPYTVFTPYKNRWLAAHHEHPLRAYPSERSTGNKLLPRELLPATKEVPQPEVYGFASSQRLPVGDETKAKHLLKHFLSDGALRYGDQRNFPAVAGTSALSPHLRAGTIGIRTCVEAAFAQQEHADTLEKKQIAIWISELIWRDFYHQILMHHPHVVDGPFDERGASVQWIDDEHGFQAWCQGRTGFPIVDAAMRQLNTYGWMHNRLRMIAASFLTKDLMIHWKHGERYFEQHLADADLAANNGGWQWSASTGTDAAPYFRVFNPITQGKTYDPNGTFVRSMIPELASIPGVAVHEPWTHSKEYPAPIVDHAKARLRALKRFGSVFGRAVKS